MIIGLVTLIMMLFGAGSVEVFYIDKIEEGVKKHITDKDRKKELQGELEAYAKAVKNFNKSREGHLKTLKKQNLDKATTSQWYQHFFEERMNDRKKLGSLFIDERIKLQQKITEEEWAKIMQEASDEATKLAEKEEKKERKHKEDNVFLSLENSTKEHISDPEKQSIVLEALDTYEASYTNVVDTYDDINVNESNFLMEKNASKEDMRKLGDLLNKQRANMYEGYTKFIGILNENSSDEEWKSIIKEFNKVIE